MHYFILNVSPILFVRHTDCLFTCNMAYISGVTWSRFDVLGMAPFLSRSLQPSKLFMRIVKLRGVTLTVFSSGKLWYHSSRDFALIIRCWLRTVTSGKGAYTSRVPLLLQINLRWNRIHSWQSFYFITHHCYYTCGNCHTQIT